MHSALTALIDRLDSPAMSDTDVISWGAPVPAFGDLSRAVVATLGLNPSNLEFVDSRGDELQGPYRRFHTLNSLGLRSWLDVEANHLRMILDSCRTYFLGNPYNRWFKRLDRILIGANASYYDVERCACHLDLIPYATSRKWTDLTFRQRASLLAIAADSLAMLVRDSPIRVIILNGRSVVEQFQSLTGLSLERSEMSEWTLSRRLTRDVVGLGYKGFADSLNGISLSRQLLVLGFNHNLQSSFGITNGAILAIREWIAQEVAETIQ